MIKVKRLNPDDIVDFTDLVKLFETVFEMENFTIPENPSLQKTLNNLNFMAYVAVQDETIIGGLTAYILAPYYSTSAEVYIYDLAVDPNFQRKGIGKQLIDTIRQDCKSLGMKEAFVQADISDQHAIDFYRSTGGNAEQVLHFSYSL